MLNLAPSGQKQIHFFKLCLLYNLYFSNSLSMGKLHMCLPTKNHSFSTTKKTKWDFFKTTNNRRVSAAMFRWAVWTTGSLCWHGVTTTDCSHTWLQNVHFSTWRMGTLKVNTSFFQLQNCFAGGYDTPVYYGDAHDYVSCASSYWTCKLGKGC